MAQQLSPLDGQTDSSNGTANGRCKRKGAPDDQDDVAASAQLSPHSHKNDLPAFALIDAHQEVCLPDRWPVFTTGNRSMPLHFNLSCFILNITLITITLCLSTHFIAIEPIPLPSVKLKVFESASVCQALALVLAKSTVCVCLGCPKDERSGLC